MTITEGKDLIPQDVLFRTYLIIKEPAGFLKYFVVLEVGSKDYRPQRHSQKWLTHANRLIRMERWINFWKRRV